MDLTKATMAAAGGGYDLRRAAQMTAGGPVALGKARQSIGGAAAHDVTKVRAGSASSKAIPTKAAKKG